VDAQCNGCGGRVMPYTHYAAHFRPTAVCASCGMRVRMRHYRTLLLASLIPVAILAGAVLMTHSVLVAAIGLALGSLLGFLADFWTFRNLSWDPDDAPPSEGGSA